jgi:hypothetical protein
VINTPKTLNNDNLPPLHVTTPCFESSSSTGTTEDGVNEFLAIIFVGLVHGIGEELAVGVVWFLQRVLLVTNRGGQIDCHGIIAQ